MISFVIRRIAVEYQTKTGRSVQEIVSEMVKIACGGEIDYSPRLICAFCSSADVITKKTDTKDGTTRRRHLCRFCGRWFRSVETVAEPADERKFIPGIQELLPAIAKTKKKRKTKDRKT